MSSYDFALSLQLRRRKAEGVGGGLSRSGGVGANLSYFGDDRGDDRGGGKKEYSMETEKFRGAGGAAALAFSLYCCFTAVLLLLHHRHLSRRWSSSASIFDLLLLYRCFTTDLLQAPLMQVEQQRQHFRIAARHERLFLRAQAEAACRHVCRVNPYTCILTKHIH